MIKKNATFALCMLFTIGIFTSSKAKWIQTNGPYGGGSVVTFFYEGTYAYANIDNELYISSNSGDNWNRRKLPTSARINAFTLFNTHIFAATDTGLFVTLDHGQTWNAAGLINERILTLAATGSNVYAGTFSNIFRSANEGKEWIKLPLTCLRVYALAALGNTMFAGTDTGAYKIADTSNTWFAVNTGLDRYWNSVMSFALSDNVIFAGLAYAGFFSSSNYGASWDTINYNMYNKPYPKSMAAMGSTVFAVTDSGISCLKEKQWTKLKSQPNYPSVITATDTVLYVGTLYNGIYRSKDRGISWESLSKGIVKTNISCLGVRGNELYASPREEGGLYRSNDKGATWGKLSKGLSTQTVTCFTVLDTAIFIGTDEGAIFRLRDSDSAWICKFSAGNPQTHVSTIAKNSTYNIIYAGLSNATRCFYQSTNNGETFTHVDQAPQNIYGNDLFIGPIICKNKTTFLQGSGDQQFCGIYYSNDGAYFHSSWIGMSISSACNITACGSDVLLYDNYGKLWTIDTTSRVSIIPKGLTGTVRRLYAKGTNLFALTSEGIYVSTNGGSAWNSFNEGLSDTNFLSGIVANDIDLFVGTSRYGVWRRPLSEIAETAFRRPTIGIPQPDHVKIVQPDAPKKPVIIELSLCRSEDVFFYAYSISGRKTIPVFNKRFEKGMHRISWATRDLPAGFYIITIQEGIAEYSKGIMVIH